MPLPGYGIVTFSPVAGHMVTSIAVVITVTARPAQCCIAFVVIVVAAA